jgi:zinc transport system substrate-binding protein
MKKWWKLAMGSLLVASLVTTGCGDKGTTESDASGKDKKLKIVTSFYPMQEFTNQVAGAIADVTVLVPAGTEPHDWEPTPKDVAKIAEADVFIYNGGGFEGWVDDILKSVNNPKLKVVEASKGIELMESSNAHDEHDEHKDEKKDGEHALDPHVWIDPILVQQEVKTITDALVEVDAAHAADYKKNSDEYIAILKDLDTTYKNELKDVKSKEFVTSHTAFAYLAKRYGLTQMPISGVSPEQEPSAAEMKEIVEFVKEHQVKTIFFETLASPKVAEAVAKEAGVETAVLNPMEGLTDEEKAKGLNYIGVMKANLDALKKAMNK